MSLSEGGSGGSMNLVGALGSYIFGRTCGAGAGCVADVCNRSTVAGDAEQEEQYL